MCNKHQQEQKARKHVVAKRKRKALLFNFQIILLCVAESPNENLQSTHPEMLQRVLEKIYWFFNCGHFGSWLLNFNIENKQHWHSLASLKLLCKHRLYWMSFAVVKNWRWRFVFRVKNFNSRNEERHGNNCEIISANTFNFISKADYVKWYEGGNESRRRRRRRRKTSHDLLAVYSSFCLSFCSSNMKLEQIRTRRNLLQNILRA